ncbi:MAG: T9SS type A sorting domain-containing protein [FCB group bacterium]|nr:T9SS type A sorting domain-containing protein [FCB group bacterium]
MNKKLLGAFVAVIFVFGLGGYNLASAETGFCDTWERYVEAYTAKMGFAPLHDCDNGDCDDPAIRDSWIPGPGDPITYVRLYFHIFREDDGSNPATTETILADQVAIMNAAYLSTRVQFVYDYRFVNSSLYRTYPYQNAMKDAYNLSPETQMNVYITNAGGGSNGTFPWGYPNDPLGPRGGIVLDESHVYPTPYHDNVLAHEAGHTLGLWHTFHGVSETAQCGECYERADGVNGDITGDGCSDTPPTPRNNYCQDPGGTDVCSGVPWGQTAPENYMSYAPLSGSPCWTEFTPQQWGRIRCWTTEILGGWFVDMNQIASVSPVQNEVDVAVSTDVSATFNIDLDPATVTTASFVVNGSILGSITGTVSYDSPTQTATFNPTDDFAVGEYITATLTTAIQSVGGDPLTASYSWMFIAEVSDNSTGDFLPHGLADVMGQPYSISAGEFDGDGDVDLAVANYTGHRISVLLNNGAGDFAAAVNYSMGGNPVCVQAADLNGDGYSDLVSSNYGSDLSVAMNNGDGTFGLAVHYSANAYPYAILVADIDGDGDNDIAAANVVSDDVSILMNNGTGTFATPVNYVVGGGSENPVSLVAADVNNNGSIDLVALKVHSDNFAVLLNNGDGTFGAAIDYYGGDAPQGICSGDFDHDGDVDVAVANQYGYVAVSLNDGEGVFSVPTDYDVGDQPHRVYAVDIDGNGSLDLVVPNSWSDDVSVLFGYGDGTFSDDVVFAVGDEPWDITAADLTGNGLLDLAVVNRSDDDVSILRQVSLTPPILVSPYNGSSTSDHTPTLNWNDVDFAISYEAVLDDDVTFTSIDRSTSNLIVSQWTVFPALGNDTWFWKVRAHDSYGPGPWSGIWMFTTYYTDPSCPVLYTYDGLEYVKDNPLLTACEKSGYVDVVTDYYHVTTPVADHDGQVRFQLRELEDEVTYLHDIELITVDHAENTDVYCSVDGKIETYRDVITPLSAVDHNGRDWLTEVAVSDGKYFVSDEPGHLILTFPAGDDDQAAFAFKYIPKQICVPIELKLQAEVPPSPEVNNTELTVEILDENGLWMELSSDIPSRENLSGDVVISTDQQEAAGEVMTLRLSWERSYSTDAVVRYITADEVPNIKIWTVDDYDLQLSKPLPGDWAGFEDGNPLVLTNGDVFDFGFNIGSLNEQGMTRDYIIRAVGRYQPDYAYYPNLLPLKYELHSNYPNPFNPMTTISYDLPSASEVRLEVYNVLGQIVITLVDQYQEAGRQQVVWNGKDTQGQTVASGTYFYRLTADEFSSSQPMILLK